VYDLSGFCCVCPQNVTFVRKMSCLSGYVRVGTWKNVTGSIDFIGVNGCWVLWLVKGVVYAFFILCLSILYPLFMHSLSFVYPLYRVC
jgi:hypothetical protein